MNSILIKTGVFTLLTLLLSSSLFGQEKIILDYLKNNEKEINISFEESQNWIITDQHQSKKSEINHVYIRQTYNDIEIFNAVANFNIKDDKVLNYGISFQDELESKISTSSPSLTPMEAIEFAANHLDITDFNASKILEAKNKHFFIIENNDISLEEIPVKLMYLPIDSLNQIRLVWDMSIYEHSKDHWWSLRVDALTGEILDKIDWVISCNFESCVSEGTYHNHKDENEVETMMSPSPPPGTDQYNVFAIPVESPSHGGRTLVVGPSDAVASPYGWHDVNGVDGNEYTITRGNNVHAYDDINNNDSPGFSPDGGPTVDFDFPLNINQNPSNYIDVAVTNLFYMNNIMHDVWYQYGFDESSGNFQENNYGNGGNGSDYVFAEAQDGGGTNNANFATPGDGNNPRMQMYLWSGTSSSILTVNTPAPLAGDYTAIEAGFGPGLSTPITADLALFDDAVAPDIYDACTPANNGGFINGKIAVLRRGDCTFVEKVANAQNEGAIAVIVVNNVAGAPIVMGGTDPSITIPSVMVDNVIGEDLIVELESGTVNGTLSFGGNFDRDGDFDNGIIAHEYGHGISTRLTGGASNSNCLFNSEQMGEGWSDWFGLMLTIESGDLSDDIRGIGTYANFEPTNGNGIRPTPYSTSFGINSTTYDATNNTAGISEPHGIGYVWCTMLWDLSWAFIDQYGYDPDVYNGTGGNNMIMDLVIEGLKLQPCNPGFVDGRDAILLADQNINGGANQCLIWEVFANRGLGFSADQGNSNSRTDQVEAFDLPTQCMAPTVSPTADFSSLLLSDCTGEVNFTDLSTDIPTEWDWDFGDGESSTLQNPTHNYSQSGTFTVTLIASNEFGSDNISFDVTISLPDSPVVEDQTACGNQTFTFNGTASGDIIWYDETGTIPLDTTFTFTTPVLNNTTTYMVENVIFAPIENVGPIDDNIGSSAYHGNATDRVINFTASSPFTLLSVWIDAGSTGTRTINIWNNSDAGGGIYATTNVNVTSTGPQRIPINLEISEPGDFSIGGANFDFARNDGGVNYPYSLAGIVDLTSSNAAGSELQYYYYLYDWEIQELPCRSGQVPVVATTQQSSSTDIIEDCSPITWIDGNTYSSSNNSATHILTNGNGCDSIVTLNFTLLSGDATTETVSACTSYTWSANSQTYTTTGTDVVTLTNVNGCDSVVTLDLTIGLIADNEIYESSCDPFYWAEDGNTYSNSGDYQVTLTGNGGCDSTIVLHFTLLEPTTGSEDITSCDSYTWSANGQTYTDNGSYQATLTGQNGCDSTATLNLTINSADAQIQAISNTILEVTTTGATAYQWIECTTGNLLNGETGIQFEGTVNGSYAAIVTVNGCQDTSACLQISGIGLDENTMNYVTIFPNPATNETNIVFAQTEAHVNVLLLASNGQVIQVNEFSDVDKIVQDLDVAPGVYFIDIQTDSWHQVTRLTVN